jgi:ABC-type Fe3+-siderophore transport system permease subunit
MRAPRTLTALVAGGMLALAVTAPVSAVLSATPTTDPIVLSRWPSWSPMPTSRSRPRP